MYSFTKKTSYCVAPIDFFEEISLFMKGIIQDLLHTIILIKL